MERNNQPAEIPPPWIKYPGYGPGDGFWRQSGEAWFKDVWEPFYLSLSDQQQKEYLARWNAPPDWQKFYFDKEFQAWLDTVDDDPTA
jgi:hypothetical protein